MTSPVTNSMHSADAFNKLPIAGGHANSSAIGRAAMASRRSEKAAACQLDCMVTTPLASFRCTFQLRPRSAAVLTQHPRSIFPTPTETGQPALKPSPVRFRPLKRSGLKQSSFPACRLTPDRLMFMPQGTDTWAQLSDSCPAGATCGGTQSTGTRDRARIVNAVPCGPPVSLVRLTPITSTLG